MTVALVVNIGLIVLSLAGAIAFTIPDVPVLTLYVVLAATAITVPILTWPVSHTVWMAIDLRFRPVDPEERAEAMAWLGDSSRKTSVPIDNA